MPAMHILKWGSYLVLKLEILHDHMSRRSILEHTVQKYSAENEEWTVDSCIVNHLSFRLQIVT